MTAILDYDAMVTHLVALKVPRDKAEARARELCGVPAPDPAAERDAAALEKVEQFEILKRFRTFGFKVYWLSQTRAAKQTPGIPDLWCMHTTLPFAFWWEAKRQKGGRFSAEQLEFRELALSTGVGYGCGDRFAAEEHLITLGLAHRDRGVLEPVR